MTEVKKQSPKLHETDKITKILIQESGGARGYRKKKSSTLDKSVKKLASSKNDIRNKQSQKMEIKNESSKSKRNEKGNFENIIKKKAELDEAKAVKNEQIIKKMLDKKYKIELPKKDNGVIKNIESIDEASQRKNNKMTKNEMAEIGHAAGLTDKEEIDLLELYGKLEKGMEQAEEFFKNIGIEWSSTHQMFKVKPKKFMPAMTMIAFGPNYDEVIVCKDDEETGKTQACKLSTGNKECPKDVTAVNLHVYNDGYQPEDETFYAYSSDSVKDFFMNNVGSYIIMKPSDSVPQTVLIKIIDERGHSFQDVQKGQTKGVSNTSKKLNAKSNESNKKQIVQEPGPVRNDADRRQESDFIRPKHYIPETAKTVPSAKVLTESVEIFERHKIIKRLEDVNEIPGGPMEPSSWYWRNQRKPMSSEYVVPSSIPASSATIKTDNIMDVWESVSKDGQRKKYGVQMAHGTAKSKAPQSQQEKQALKDQFSEAKINKINIYHGPVTVINLGDRSEESVALKTTLNPERYQISTGRKQEAKDHNNIYEDSLDRECTEVVCSLSARHSKKNTQDSPKLPILEFKNERNLDESLPTSEFRFKRQGPEIESEMYIPELNAGYNIYESEYQDKYSKSAGKWSELFQKMEGKKSVEGNTSSSPGEQIKYQHITIFGQTPCDEETALKENSKSDKKPAVLLDLGGRTGTNEINDLDPQGVVLNRKTSDTQVTVSLKDNNNGKIYLVNIYPEEQLKRIWSILKLNNIRVNDVTPHLILGSAELKKELESKPLPDVSEKKKKEDKAINVDEDSLKNEEISYHTTDSPSIVILNGSDQSEESPIII